MESLDFRDAIVISVRSPLDFTGGDLLVRKKYAMLECASVEIGRQRRSNSPFQG